MNRGKRILLSTVLAVVLSVILNLLADDKTIISLGTFIIVFISVLIFTLPKERKS